MLNDFTLFVYSFKLRRKIAKTKRPLMILVDLDGVLTDGKFIYSDTGKEFKIFGAHDNRALQNLNLVSRLEFISADNRGFQISKTRINDMGFELSLMNSQERFDFIKLNKTKFFIIFLCDSNDDLLAQSIADYSIVPGNSSRLIKMYSNIALKEVGGENFLTSVSEIVLKTVRYEKKYE
jgi:3-deoxy-D-manno-octulosonate 8-phosphate phosphatase (KDO 8-P phosphatase)